MINQAVGIHRRRGYPARVLKQFRNRFKMRNDADVTAFQINNAPNMTLFPTNLENVFGNLKLIALMDSKLKMITKENIQPFSNLRYLILEGNEIETIYEDTFMYNPKLKFIQLNHNQIRHIDSLSFVNLNNLRLLALGNNTCDWLYTAYNVNSVKTLVNRIENRECYSTA